MKLNYRNLKEKYLNHFENQQHCDFILTDVLFCFSEILDFIEDTKISKVLEIGCGTGILLRELSFLFPEKKFFGLDPHESGFHNYEKISTNLKMNNNLSIIKKKISNFSEHQNFDLIFSFNVFEHIKNQEEYLQTTNKLLNKDGKNLIMCPNYDFPYEPHFVIPIIINKKFTKFFFKNKINNHEKKTNEIGLWEGLNLNGRNKINNYLEKNHFDFRYDFSIKDRFFERLNNDESKYFHKRQGLAAKLALFGKMFLLDKFIFDLLKIPFPYIKLIINKNLKVKL